MFGSFVTVAPIAEESFTRFGSQVPVEFVQAWHDHGAGFIGDGYFRLVDPGRAAAMLGSASPFPSDWVILLATAMADLVAWRDGYFAVAKTRMGEIHLSSESAATVVGLLDDEPGFRDVIWDQQPYPVVRDRLGVPAFEDCFMHVPLLLMGGRGDAGSMQVGGLWPHVGLMTQLTGKPRITHMLPLPTGE